MSDLCSFNMPLINTSNMCIILHAMAWQVLKLYAWEGAFSSMVDKIRRKEMNLLQKVAIYRALNSFLSGTSPYTVSY